MQLKTAFLNPTRVLGVVAGLSLLGAQGTARAGEPSAHEATLVTDARAYYEAEMIASWLFVGFGAVTAGGGGVTLTQPGDFARGLGASSLVLGGLTALGGAGYAVAVKTRGDYYTRLSSVDLAQFHREEADHIAGTDRRFWLYLGSELAETLAGVGLASYGLATKNDLVKGIGVGAAIQGIGLLVIDVPGAGRAARYRERLRSFAPRVGFSVGGGGRPWAATLSQTF